MRTAILKRAENTDAGTFGTLVTDSGFACRTGELPWRSNKAMSSCIPPGTYQCAWKFSPKFGDCYHVENVPGRTAILIHPANFVGDRARGFKSEVLGCITVGTSIAPMDGQLAVWSSKLALSALEKDLGNEPFELTIIDATDQLSSK